MQLKSLPPRPMQPKTQTGLRLPEETEQQLSNFSPSESPGISVRTQGSESTPVVSDPAGQGQGPRIFISSKLPGDADVPGLGTTPGEPLKWMNPEVCCYSIIPYPKRWKRATNLRRGIVGISATPSDLGFTLLEIHPK